MILKFGVKNYRSIKELLVFDLQVTPEMKFNNKNLIVNENEVKATRINFIYGNNGSGKSNLISAIGDLKKIAIKKNIKKLEGASFKLADEEDNEMFFTTEFIWNQFRYRYSVIVNSKIKNIINERLEILKNNKIEILYDKLKNIYFTMNNSEKERLNTFDLKNRSLLNLFNSEIVISDEAIKTHLSNSFDFFNNIHIGFRDIDNIAALSSLKKDNNKLLEITKIMKKYDLTISDLQIKEELQDFDEFAKENKTFIDNIIESAKFKDILKLIYTKSKINLEIYHGNQNLNYLEESAGTRKAMSAISSVIMNSNGIWFIDDFETDLHTRNTIEFIKYITSNYSNNQFVFVTHELELLDFELVKFKPLHYLIERDNESYNSTITRLSDFPDLRTDIRHNWKKFYEENRLGKYPNPKILD